MSGPLFVLYLKLPPHSLSGDKGARVRRVEMLRSIDVFALLVYGAALLEDRSFAQPSHTQSVDCGANIFALTTVRSAPSIDSAALFVVST